MGGGDTVGDGGGHDHDAPNWTEYWWYCDEALASAVVDVSGRVWLLDWEDGETISSELSRRMDLAQTLALTASVAGVEEAIASASRVEQLPALIAAAELELTDAEVTALNEASQPFA